MNKFYLFEQMDITSKQQENYNTVWFELLKQKVQIIYDIALFKKVDFIELLNEMIPEANNYKDLWEHKYIPKKKSEKPIKFIKKSVSIQ
jgi:hypothetical protein